MLSLVSFCCNDYRPTACPLGLWGTVFKYPTPKSTGYAVHPGKGQSHAA